MTPEQFCYWLQGYFELITEVDPYNTYCITPEQINVIREHLSKVFNKPKGLKPVEFDIYDQYGHYVPNATLCFPTDGHPQVVFPEISYSC